ncbi:MAG: hypothetical protein ACP5IM_00040 [Candidatus Bathyarchaeia archaeon]
MAPEKVVLDASVIPKWYLKEKYSEQALKLRDMRMPTIQIFLKQSIGFKSNKSNLRWEDF